MTWKITELDFLNSIDRHSCRGRPVEEGRAEQGHENCRGCQGNYLVKGECNWGGKHTVAGDLEIINKNFDRFDLLFERQDAISKAVSEKDFNQQKERLIRDYEFLIRQCESKELDFFSGTCIGIENKQELFLNKVKQSSRLLAAKIKDFIKQVRELDYWKLKNWQDKIEQLEKLAKEAQTLASQYKDAVARGDTVEANRLKGLIAKNQTAAANLKRELEKDSVNQLFGENMREVFKNIAQSIWKGETDFWKTPEEQEKNTSQSKEKKFLGFIPQKYAKKVKWGGGILLLVLIFYLIFRKFFK